MFKDSITLGHWTYFACEGFVQLCHPSFYVDCLVARVACSMYRRSYGVAELLTTIRGVAELLTSKRAGLWTRRRGASRVTDNEVGRPRVIDGEDGGS